MKTSKICLVILCLLPVRAVGLPRFSGANFFMETEIWKDVEGYEGFYMVSSKANIKRLAITDTTGRGYYKKPELIIKQHINKFGYMNIRLSKNGIQSNIKVHRIVAMAFIDNPENKPFINHIDGNKKNNDVNNLEWCTQSENIVHAYKAGLMMSRSGFNHHYSRFILNKSTGIFYGSVTEAALAHCIKPDTLRSMIIGRIKNRTDIVVA